MWTWIFARQSILVNMAVKVFMDDNVIKPKMMKKEIISTQKMYAGVRIVHDFKLSLRYNVILVTRF